MILFGGRGGVCLLDAGCLLNYFFGYQNEHLIIPGRCVFEVGHLFEEIQSLFCPRKSLSIVFIFEDLKILNPPKSLKIALQ